MIASISVCPKCNTLILEDTAMCPQCHHVLQEGADHLKEVFEATDKRYDGSKDISCRECNAMNREGLVRCWQCGAFLKEEIERLYQEMQLRPAQIIEDLPEDDIDDAQQAPAGVQEPPSPDAAPPESDADFELNDDFEMFEAGEDWSGGQAQYLPAFQDDEDDEDEVQAFTEDGETEAEEQQAPTEEEEELLKLAETEQSEEPKKAIRRKKSQIKNSFLVKCTSCECKIRVPRYRQGELGQCPKCKQAFIVPIIEEKKTAAPKVQQSLPEEDVIEDVSWHEIAAAKFKPKDNALKGKGEKIDLIRWDGQWVAVWLKQKGLKGKPDEQRKTIRNNIATHLKAKRNVRALPVDRQEILTTDDIQKLQFAYPSSEEHFSGGLPIFGEGIIGVELPLPPAPAPEAIKTPPALGKGKKPKKPKKPKAPPIPPNRCLSLTITQYRKLKDWVNAVESEKPVLENETLPLEDQLQTYTCALSETEFEAIQDPSYLLNDPARPLVEVGWKCQACEAAVSEAARAENKLGGKKPAGLAKAKCPKCEEKFGKNPLYHFKSVVDPDPEPVEESEEAKSAESKEETKPKKKGLGGLFGRKAAKPDSKDAETESAKKSDSDSAEKKPAEEAESETSEVAETEEAPAKKKGLFGGLLGKKKPKKSKTSDESEEPAAETAKEAAEAPEAEAEVTTKKTPKKKKSGGLFGRKKAKTEAPAEEAATEEAAASDAEPAAEAELAPKKKKRGGLFGRKKKADSDAETAE